MRGNQERVRYWFEQALEVITRERPGFLERGCDDTAVREDVLALLEYDTGPATELASAIRGAMATVLAGNGAAPPVARVGAFELGRLLGSGGMGFVYEGHRADGAVRQRVAIKFAQVSPAATAEFRERAHRRFARERQTLASLRHPYIAGLIDAGATGDGTPYAVIERVDGAPIDAYCDGALPHHADRIRLFLKLCEAVEFAHRNLVVHSDIKPDNVLVTPDGIPKLIDFGVAGDLSAEARNSTVRGFTPGYASPEQCLGLPATVATDVYGLGAVLYRLLAGAPPRHLRSESIDEAIRQITEEEPARPSSLRPELRGDLENILLKALQREPNRRYGSVHEFADDLQRYLERRPVSASPDSPLYRCSRFVRRHWLTLAAAAMLAAALMIATAVSVRQRHEAVKRAADTRRLAERLLFEVHDEIENAVGGTRAREKLGEIAAQYLEGLERDHPRDPELAWELLSAYSRLAQSRGGAAASIGDTKSAAQLAARALALGRVVEDFGLDGERGDKLFAAYNGLTGIFAEAGRLAEQRETVERLVRLSKRLGPVREAEALKQLARWHDAAGMALQSAEAWGRALAILRSLPEEQRAKPGAGAELTSTLVGYGRAQALAGDFEGSIRSLREAIERSREQAASGPARTRSARHLYWSYIALGDALGSPLRFSLERVAEAAAQYRKARAIAEQLAKADPGNESARLDLARAFSREGLALAASQPAAALALLEQSRDAAAQTSRGNYSGLDARLAYLTSSVPPLVQLGQLERARAHLGEARRVWNELKREGMAAPEKDIVKGEAILAYAAGRRAEAVQAARRLAASMPVDTRPVLSENHPTVDAFEQLRSYARGFDGELCESASNRLAKIWTDLRAAYPGSEFVRARAARAEADARSGCATGAAGPAR